MGLVTSLLTAHVTSLKSNLRGMTHLEIGTEKMVHQNCCVAGIFKEVITPL